MVIKNLVIKINQSKDAIQYTKLKLLTNLIYTVYWNHHIRN